MKSFRSKNGEGSYRRAAAGVLVLLAFAFLAAIAYPARDGNAASPYYYYYTPPPPDEPIAATGTNFSATEGASFSGTVATFTDPDTSATASEYTATIAWGDGSNSSGTIAGPVGGPFTVSGTHTYLEEGAYAVAVTIIDVDNTSNRDTATSVANVADAALTATGLNAISGLSFSGTVANFTDANTAAPVSDFTATIDWGDGSAQTGGTVSGSGGSFKVDGSHTYGGTGPFTVKVHILDEGGSTADATTTILIYGVSAGGTFVIGNGRSAVGTNVTFWSAQWSTANTLSGGSAPASFKGFANAPSTLPACGAAWKTDPGSSSEPPNTIPAYMAVIVSSSINESGPTINGNNTREIVVKTNPGYAPNPGHAGTGTVVAVIC